MYKRQSFNFERIHGLGFCYDMIPAIKRLYPLKEDQVAALRRHLVFFNTTPAVCGPVIGVTAAMEEARANGAEIDDGTINGIKVGLMGPLAGAVSYTHLDVYKRQGHQFIAVESTVASESDMFRVLSLNHRHDLSEFFNDSV